MSEKPSHNHARDRLYESLSATMDGQASELEMRRVLETLGGDDDLRAKAQRYQLMGDAIRHETSDFAQVDLSSRIRDRIDQEEAAHQPDEQHQTQPEVASVGLFGNVFRSLSGNGWPPAGRVAIAASVAFAVVVGVRNYNQVDIIPTVADVSNQTTLSQPLQIAQNDYGATGLRAGYSSREHNTITPEQLAHAQNIATQATRERFRAYALQHAEMNAVQSGQGLLPFARLTSFDKQ